VQGLELLAAGLIEDADQIDAGGRPFQGAQHRGFVADIGLDDVDLADIAVQLGFSAQSAMARWFRGRFGCTITAWRKGVRP
jgi:AraC-like DNA-binding protein